MNVRYRVELNQAERSELTAMLSGGKRAARKLKRAQLHRKARSVPGLHLRLFAAVPPPACRGRHAAQVTPPSVHQMVLTLERAGLIRRQPGVARSIELLVAPQHLPILE